MSSSGRPPSSEPPRRARVAFRGIAASPGVATGPAFRVDPVAEAVPRRRLRAGATEAEVERLRVAFDGSRRELEELRGDVGQEADAEVRLILDAQLMMHGDALLADATIGRIRDEGINAEWALREVLDELEARLGAASSGYFRARAADVEQVGTHVLRFLGGGDARPAAPDVPSVLVARDLGPADAARLFKEPTLGVVTALGSATGHTAILARALAIPAVVGVTDLTRVVSEGEPVIVDALFGEVVVGAPEAEQSRAADRSRRYFDFLQWLEEKRDPDTRTRDGVPVTIAANVDLPGEVPHVQRAGAKGVGLFRTEFLFLEGPDGPGEDAQLATYRETVEALAPHPVTFRTCDLGADKLLPNDRTLRSQNPALGLRALRLSLARPEPFRAQLAAILRAAAFGPARLMFPLVTSVGELQEARQHLEEVRAELVGRGEAIGDPPVGVMIEVPAAALAAERLAARCDFFSVGTNDLVQYTLAADRLNPWVAGLARGLEPAVLRLLSLVVAASEAHDAPPSVCGDMSSDPLALPVLVGLGYRSFSMPFSAIPLAREVLRRIDVPAAEDVARRALDLDGAAQTEALVREAFEPDLGELWREQGLG